VKIFLLVAALALLVGHGARIAPRPAQGAVSKRAYGAPASPIDGPILLGSEVIGANAFWSGLAL
jgi:hypothetical protein